MPGKANQVLQEHHLLSHTDIAEKVASTLQQNGVYDKAGELYENIGKYDLALAAFHAGNVYRSAVELARAHFPAQVVSLEEVFP